jgi:hypothetical protein
LKKLIILFYFFTITFYFFTLGCNIDKGIKPTQSGFNGTIYFQNEKPQETDQVIVVASTKFPPTNITEIVQGEPLSLDSDSVYYEIWTPPTDFAAVGVVWKEKDQPWDVTNIIGIYFPTENKFSPGNLSLPDKNTVVESINIQADFSKAKKNVESYLSGTLTVNGNWPENATSVLVVASPSLVPGGLLDITFGQPIEAGFETAAYSLNIQPGKYGLIGCLVLREDEPIGIQSINGIYYKKPGDLFPGSVSIPTDTTRIENINISINFN